MSLLLSFYFYLYYIIENNYVSPVRLKCITVCNGNVKNITMPIFKFKNVCKIIYFRLIDNS